MDYKAFFDLNIELSTDYYLWKGLCDNNIRTVAINQRLDTTSIDDTKKKKNEKKEDIVPHPIAVEIPKECKNKIMAVKRLTISLSDGNIMHKIIQSPNFKLYDIIAVAPTTHAAFQTCCASNDIDIICFDPQSKPQWSISRKLYKIAVNKNIFFELPYSHIISDSTSRKNIIQIAHTYHTVGKSKNIVISSGTGKAALLRSPYDVINFCFLLGFNEKKAKETVTSNPKQLLLQAGSRRRNKSLINVTILSNSKSLTSEKDEEMEVEDKLS